MLRADPLALDRATTTKLKNKTPERAALRCLTLGRFYTGGLLVWRRRRPLELRMPPARSRQRKRTRRTQRAHSVSRQGPRQVPPLLMWFEISRKRNRSEVGCMPAAKFARARHAWREWRRQALDRALEKICVRSNMAVHRMWAEEPRGRDLPGNPHDKLATSRACVAGASSSARAPKKKVSLRAGNDSLSLTNSRSASVEASLKKLLAFSRV